MDKTVADVRDKWDRLMFGLYVNKNIPYSADMDNKFVRGNFSYGGYCEGTFKKSFTSDIDNTATKGPALPSWLIEGLSLANSLIKKVRGKLHNDIDTLPYSENQDEVKATLRSFCDDLARCKMHRSEFIEASEYAAKNVELVPNYDKLVKILDDMGYIVSLSTGSPLECALYLAQKRLKITTAYIGKFGIQERIFGSIFKFNPNTGYYTGEMVSGVDNKSRRMKEIQRSTGCNDELSISLDDDPRSKLASVAGMSILAVDHYWFKKLFGQKFPGKLKIICPEARHNMDVVVDIMKMYDRFRTVTYIMTPEAELELYNLSLRFKGVYENALKSKDVKNYKMDFLECASQISTRIAPIVTERSLNVSDLIKELCLFDDAEKVKTLMVDIYNKFERIWPEPQARKGFGNALKNIIKEKQMFSEIEWWLQCQKA